MPKYKLTYFNARARGELPRLVFNLSGIEFEDKRIEFKDWPALKPTVPLGTLPMLEVDGEQFCQSTAIARYIAKQTGLAGKDDKEAFRADEIVDFCGDVFLALVKSHFEKDETKKAELNNDLKEKTVPNFLRTVTKKLTQNGGTFLVGKSPTWADLAVFNILDSLSKGNPTLFDEAPELKAHSERIGKLPKLRDYLESRPPSDL